MRVSVSIHHMRNSSAFMLIKILLLVFNIYNTASEENQLQNNLLYIHYYINTFIIYNYKK